MSDLYIIDTHMHIFNIEKFPLPWMEHQEYSSLKKNFPLTQYLEDAENYDLMKAIYVETNVRFEQLREEVDTITRVCKDKTNPLAAMVICADMESENLEEYLKTVLPNPYVKGVRRVLIFDDTPKGTCLNPQFIENLKLLPQYRMTFEICMRPNELNDMIKAVDLCPETNFILDHIGNGGLQSSEFWLKGIEELGRRDNVVGCKVSGMIESTNGAWKPEDLIHNFEACLKAFGDDRLMFGSNWPVITLGGSFEDWIEALLKITMNKTDAFIRKFFYTNAERIYRL